MPSSIFFNGQRLYRPGTYVRVNDTLSAISDLTGGNIALVGDFPIFAQAEIQTFASFDTFIETIAPAGGNGVYHNIDYRALADLSFDALEGATQQIDSLSIINTRGTTQAEYADNGLTVKSKLYGTDGNQLAVSLSSSQDRTNDAADAPYWDINVWQGGPFPVETMNDIGDGVAAQLEYVYTEDLAGDADGEFNYGEVQLRITGGDLQVKAEYNVTAAAIATETNASGDYELKFNKQIEGVVKATMGANQAAANNVMVVKGFNSAGQATSESVALHNAAAGSQEIGVSYSTTNEFVFLESITLSAATDGDVDLTWFPKSTPLEDVGDLSGWLADLNRRNSDFTVVAPSTVITGDELDRSSAYKTISSGTKFDFKTDLARIVQRAFNASNFLIASKTSNEAPAAFAAPINLRGGVIEASTPVTDVQAALDSIMYKNINIVVPATDDIEIHKLVKKHCNDAAEKAGSERNCWLGTEADRTLDYVHNIYIKELNDRNCAVVCQGIMLKKTNKSFPTPWYTALALASVQAATPIAEPMTRKIIQGIEPIQTTFDPDADANKAIRLSIVVINSAVLHTIRVERSVTTYRRNLDHPVFCEVSANESVNTCLRTLRAKLAQHIGTKATADQAQLVSRAAQSILSDLREKAIIANYKDVSVVLSGDVLNITFDLAAIEPLNFITVQANLGQF